MPNVQSSVDIFISEIEAIERKFEKDIAKLTARLSAMSDTQLIKATSELNFLQELIDSGYGKALDNFDESYTSMLKAAIGEATKRGIPTLSGASLQSLETLKDMDFERLLGRASIYSNELKTQLFRGVFANANPKQITDNLINKGKRRTSRLASHQLNVVAYDGLKIFDDMSRYKTFQGQDVRWTYIGPQDAHTRQACQDTKANEPEEGYKEKDVPTETPFGVRGGFNCRHSWMIR